MKETDRIKKLFSDLYNGSPWIDVNIEATLNNISAGKAAQKIAQERNSIWEIVNHIILWRINVLSRIKGLNTASSPDNYFSPVPDTSEKAWKETLQRLEETQQQWLTFLSEFDETQLESVYQGNNMTYYEHIHGIMQHDAYHLGQIRLLALL